jgi:PAS domain S-box-containing protein
MKIEPEKSAKKTAKTSKNDSEVGYKKLIQKINAPVLIHDSTTKIIACNSAAQKLTGLTEDQLMGRTAMNREWHMLREDGSYMPGEEFPVNKVLASKQAVRGQVLGIHMAGKDITWGLVNGDPIFDDEGNISEVIVTFNNITDRIQNNAINSARFRLMQFAGTHTIDELLEETLNEAERLTNSVIGFYHFVEDDQISLTLQNWSTRTKAEFCKAEGKGMHYPIDQAGVWVDCIVQRKPVIHNDYASLPHKKGMPPGHATVIRELVTPVIRGDKVKAILGVGNKPVDYVDKDIEAITLVADLAWEIAERKILDEALRKANTYNRSLIEASLDPLVTISPEGKITDVNNATEKATGRNRSELIGTDFSNYFTEPEKAREGYQKVFTKGYVTDYPMAIRRNDGHVIDVLYNASVYRDGAGKVIGIFAAARDVTERKHSEDELNERDKHSQSLLRLSRSLEQAQSYADVLNAARNEVRNTLGYQNLWAYLLSEDKKYFKALVAQGPTSDFIMSEEGTATLPIEGDKMLEEIAAAKELVLIEDAQTDSRVNKEIVKQMGNRTIINVPIILFDRHLGTVGTGTFGDEGVKVPSFSGQKYLMALASHVAVTFDRIHLIVQRKKSEVVLRESEEALKVAQRIAHLGSWHMNLVTNEVVWSEVLYKIYGFDPTKPPPLYTESLKLFTLESWELLSSSIANCAQTGAPYEVELETVNKEGNKGWIWARGELVRDPDGVPLRIQGVVMDITERKRAEEEITRLNKELEKRVVERTEQLEAANKELEAFSYSVSHDLRGPLRAINGFSQILEEDYIEKLDEEGRRLLGVIRYNANRMGKLIDDILKFSRTGRFEMNFSVIDMEKLAHEAYSELISTAKNEVKIEIGQLPVSHGDRAMIYQVFINLLSNAIKFTSGKEKAQVEIGSDEGENETVYFIKDNGVGFDMQYVDKLFGVFERLHSVEEFEGTGIGLALVKRIVNRHGGRVWAEGKINEGATIYFTLPNKQ